MYFSMILFYGQPGLEADIFQSYMRCSGYPVHLITGDLPPSLRMTILPASVGVIALQKPAEDLVGLAREMLSSGQGYFKRIFILADGQPVPATEPEVEVIYPPFRLSGVIKRIQALSRQENG